MKTKMLMKSGIAMLLLAGTGFATAGTGEGDLYDKLRSFHESQEVQSPMTRGAAGPIREAMDVQPAANDIYDSLKQFHAAQQMGMGSEERGARGPIRSEADMAATRSEQEWRQMVGIFYGSD